MKVNRDTIAIRTEKGQEFLDVTTKVQDAVRRSKVRDGVLLISSLHTTTALFVNEFQPALLEDVASVLQKLIPQRHGYLHDDPRYSDCDRGNAHAYLRATLLGPSITLAIVEGGLLLGQYQSVIVAELDGPRDRRFQIHIIGE